MWVASRSVTFRHVPFLAVFPAFPSFLFPSDSVTFRHYPLKWVIKWVKFQGGKFPAAGSRSVAAVRVTVALLSRYSNGAAVIPARGRFAGSCGRAPCGILTGGGKVPARSPCARRGGAGFSPGRLRRVLFPYPQGGGVWRTARRRFDVRRGAASRYCHVTITLQ